MASEVPRILTRQQQQLLNDIAAAWRRDQKWPRAARLRLAYRKVHADFDVLLHSIPVELWHHDRTANADAHVVLTVAGVEASEGGEREVRPFLQLVQLAVERYVADPWGNVQISHADILSLIGDQRDALRRLGELYRSNWSFGSGVSASGEMDFRISFGILRYDGVRTAWRYEVRRRRAPRKLERLEQVHSDLMRAIYEPWHDTGAWPETVGFIVGHRASGDIETLLREIPESIMCSFSPGTSERLDERTHGARRARFQ